MVPWSEVLGAPRVSREHVMLDRRVALIADPSNAVAERWRWP
jgi:hypothetical protein